MEGVEGRCFRIAGWHRVEGAAGWVSCKTIQQTNGRTGSDSRRWSAGARLWNYGRDILLKKAALIPSPIHKVLSTFQSFGVRALLMGGQACVFHGGAEFSRDTDFALHADDANLEEGLAAEEQAERAAARAYWAPPREELERMRRS